MSDASISSYDGLFPKHVENTLPSLGSTDHVMAEESIAQVKFFNPVGGGTWYATEYDPKDKLFFGWADLGSPELGYFSLTELESYTGPLGLGIERDMYWSPTPLSEVMGG